MKNLKKYSGFTLIEIAIVLIIVTVLLGYTMAMIPVQQDLKQYKKADAQMNKIIDSLYAFAQVNGYLPCPAWDDGNVPPVQTSNGLECRDADSIFKNCNPNLPASNTCDVWFGYVPGKALGLEGSYSTDSGLLLDPWGQPYWYQVAEDKVQQPTPVTIASSTGNGNFTIDGDMQKAGMALLAPDLSVCNAETTSNTGCDDASERIVEEIPAVILSTGKDRGETNSNSPLEAENIDSEGAGNTTATAADKVFVKAPRGDDFDDLVKWISPNTLYSKMIEAGQLP